MKIKNISQFSSDVFYCYSLKLKNYLTKHNIQYIDKGKDDENNLNYWVFLKTDELFKLIHDYNVKV